MSKSKRKENKFKGKDLDCYIVCKLEQQKQIEEHLLGPLGKAFKSVQFAPKHRTLKRNLSK